MFYLVELKRKTLGVDVTSVEFADRAEGEGFQAIM